MQLLLDFSEKFKETLISLFKNLSSLSSNSESIRKKCKCNNPKYKTIKMDQYNELLAKEQHLKDINKTLNSD